MYEYNPIVFHETQLVRPMPTMQCLIFISDRSKVFLSFLKTKDFKVSVSLGIELLIILTFHEVAFVLLAGWCEKRRKP